MKYFIIYYAIFILFFRSEVHRQRDIIQDEKDDILKDQQRAYKQATRRF